MTLLLVLVGLLLGTTQEKLAIKKYEQFRDQQNIARDNAQESLLP